MAKTMRKEKRSLRRQEVRSKARGLNEMRERDPPMETPLIEKVKAPAQSNQTG